MDSLTLDRYRQIIESILLEYTQIPYAYGEIQTEAVFDREHDRYLLVNTGWDTGKRVHGCLVHVDLVDENSGSSATDCSTASPENSSPREYQKSTSFSRSGHRRFAGLLIM